MFKEAVLYYRPDCPYCKEVLDYMKREGIEDVVEKKSVYDEGVQAELEQVSGQDAVPCLIADGEKYVGAELIIAYFNGITDVRW